MNRTYVTLTDLATTFSVSRPVVANWLQGAGLITSGRSLSEKAVKEGFCRIVHRGMPPLVLWHKARAIEALQNGPRNDWGQVLLGDCREILPTLPRESVNTACFSPPYASSRKVRLGAPDAKDYPAWVMDWMSKIWPLLTADGSVAIVIRPNVADGQMTDYVLRTRLALRERGWYEHDELIWIKPDGAPLGNPKWPRRSWESILWFSKSTKPYCNAKANGNPSNRIGWPETKWHGDWISGVSPFKSGIARSPDYVVCPVAANLRGISHSMQYPVPLAEWIIRLLCPEGGLVLDPFAGSGSTLVAAKRTGRRYCGIEIEPKYYGLALERLRTET